jgi:hypothetical protein
MMTANRKFQLWSNKHTKFPIASGEAIVIVWYLKEHFTSTTVSTSTLYRMKPNETKMLTKDHSQEKLRVKCIK